MKADALRSPLLTAVVGLVAVALGETPMRGYTTNGWLWSLPRVPYRLNPANLDLPGSQAEAAVRAGADVWSTQTNTSFRFVFAGPSTQTSITNDSINLVIFRPDPNSGNPNAIATTYTWASGSTIIDTDIVFWDGAFRFFSGSTGCVSGFYIEDIAAHEFGHALGLGHTSTPGATMYPTISYCNTDPRTLHADDIAGVLSLYPPATPPSAPTGLVIVR